MELDDVSSMMCSPLKNLRLSVLLLLSSFVIISSVKAHCKDNNMVRHDLIVALSLYVIASASAFIVGPARIASRPLSPLCAVPADPQGVNNPEENNASGGEEHALPSESDTDILNSPAFLKRKLEVLKSDIAQADADVEALKVQVEEGKAEWGQQLDDLQLEVCL